MARPRSISNETILATAYDLLMAEGLSNFTFERLGVKVGLVPAALVRRFKNKKQLIIEVDRFALARTNAEIEKVMDESLSPIEAIIALFTTELAFATSISRLANGQEILFADFRDDNLYANYRVSFEHRHEQVVELLKKAETTGYLRRIANVHALATHLEMIQHGAGHVWAMTQDKSIADYIADNVRFALQPYLKG
jgi:AcrR family transcriptional regulator